MQNKLIYKVLLILFLFTTISISQQMKIISGGEIAFIPEIKGVINFENKMLKISSLKNQSSGEDKINLKIGDEILYVNGKRVKSLESFNANYEKTEIGSDVKLGVKRKDEMLIATFKKQDPTKFKDKIMRFKSKDDSNVPQKIELKNEKVMLDGKETKMDSLKY